MKKLRCTQLLSAIIMSCMVPAVLAEKKPIALEEVVVTAQKKQSTLQDTPIALDAFNEDALQREGIGNVGDLANNVPAMTIQPFPINTTTLRIYIRGIGLIDPQITQDAPVGVYLDGGYIARSSALATDLADLQRIEVLRGPQGTLYGRNSTGGAVNLITRRPNVDEREFRQSLTFGDRNLFTSKTMFNTPLWDGAAGKISYFRKSVDGYIKNSGLGGDFGDNETEGYRVDFAWDVTATVHVDYAYDKAEVNNTNMTYSQARPKSPLSGTSSGVAFNNLINNGAQQFFDYNPSESLPDEIFSAVEIPEARNVIEGHQLSVDWLLDEVTAVKYIFAMRDLLDSTPTNLSTGAKTDGYRLDNEPLFGFPVAVVPGGAAPCTPLCVGRSVMHDGFIPDILQDQYSHELQLSGDMFDSSVSYITGLYYFNETATFGADKVGHLLSAPLGSTATRDNTTRRIEVMTQAKYAIENSAAAIFAQMTWRPPVLDDRLRFTLGARHSEDNRKARSARRQISFIVTPGDGDNLDRDDLDSATQLPEAFYDETGDKDFSDDSFTFISEFEISDDVNAYYKMSEAYKSGGFNIREEITAAGAERFRNGFNEEKVTAHELGLKSRFFQNRFQFNADIFRQEFENQQLNFVVPGAVSDTTVANAGSSVLQGFEMDSTWLVSEGLLLVLNYAFLDAEINPSRNPLSGEVEDNFVFDSAPKHAYTAALDWTLFDSVNYGRWAFNATYSFTDERNGGGLATASTYQQDKMHSFAVLNARLGAYEVEAFDGRLNIAVWSKNVLNEEYSVNNIHNLPQADRSVMFGEPRSYGLDLIYNWGS
ncbi:TonB-dependent receptor [Zhongshania sp.]|jgi:iron complex outermembrane receptor protein|uniref:TonB-dependent receptor n=1 Tax=Zhongshania sp. TaxID=1971902 RepID=UPI0039E48704